LFGLRTRNVASDLVLVEDPPHLCQEARQLAGELEPLVGRFGEVQQLLANQVGKPTRYSSRAGTKMTGCGSKPMTAAKLPAQEAIDPNVNTPAGQNRATHCCIKAYQAERGKIRVKPF
jgi:hypothetical protein